PPPPRTHPRTAAATAAGWDWGVRAVVRRHAGAVPGGGGGMGWGRGLWGKADARFLAFTALHGRRIALPFRLAAPLNRETAEALGAWAGEKSGAQVYSGHG
ncbi:hypothetical protein, partial [Escherichia coli]|uniref:hypothetical protein n=1 Tax=Escherichia coli TaxID=562 RepID=UPI0035E43209